MRPSWGAHRARPFCKSSKFPGFVADSSRSYAKLIFKSLGSVQWVEKRCFNKARTVSRLAPAWQARRCSPLAYPLWLPAWYKTASSAP